MREKIKTYRTLVANPEGKRPLVRQRSTWVDNLKMDLREIGWGGIDWSDLVQDRDQWATVVNTIMSLQVPQNAGKFFSSYATGSFSRMDQIHEVSQLFPKYANIMEYDLCVVTPCSSETARRFGGTCRLQQEASGRQAACHLLVTAFLICLLLSIKY
jgi:hypothetical protein